MATGLHAGLDLLGRTAAGYVENGMKVGLGTGRAAAEFVRALAARVRDERLGIVGVATSEATRALAENLGLTLATLDEAGALDLTIDGADEVDPRLDLVKGLGGAMVREKIVAASSRRVVIVVGAEKLVERLGVRAAVPIEVVPFGLSLCARRVVALGAQPSLRGGVSAPFVSDNGNYVLDCQFSGIDDAESLDRALRDIPGVVGTGIFAGIAERVLVQEAGKVRVLEREPRPR